MLAEIMGGLFEPLQNQFDSAAAYFSNIMLLVSKMKYVSKFLFVTFIDEIEILSSSSPLLPDPFSSAAEVVKISPCPASLQPKSQSKPKRRKIKKIASWELMRTNYYAEKLKMRKQRNVKIKLEIEKLEPFNI